MKTCKRGHEWTESNTRWGKRPNGTPRRHCRACLRENWRKKYWRNRAVGIYKYKAKMVEMSNSSPAKYLRERYKNSPEIRKQVRGYVLKWVAKNQEKLKAHRIFHRAVENGKIERGKCFVCGAERVDGHHEDYSKPLEVVWVCRKHHKDIHKGIVKLPLD